MAGTRKSAPFSLSVSEVGRSGYIWGKRGGALGALSDSNSDTCDISSSWGGVFMKASSTSSVEQTVYKEVNLITVHYFAIFHCTLLFTIQLICSEVLFQCTTSCSHCSLTSCGSRAGHLLEVSLGGPSPVLVWRGSLEPFLQTRNFVELPFWAQGGLAMLGAGEKIFSCFLLCVCMCNGGRQSWRVRSRQKASSGVHSH